MSGDPNSLLPVPMASPISSMGTGIHCPRCQSPQFFGERRITKLGITLILVGFFGMLLSIPLMLLYVGFCSFILFLPLPIIAAFQRKYVNVCARCRQIF